MAEKGTISIHSENIFPIIKKFLYSDNEIFLRELVSNAVDATQKLKHLAAMGEYDREIGEAKVKVAVDKEAKTITVSDSGIGMTADEIKKYINQIAFSGATEFLEKYKDKSETETSDIIGHFGLGFYSAFMVADTVEIDSLSHQKNSKAAHWTCDGSTEFEITDGNREERGTDIILNVSEDGAEFLDPYRLEGILKKYAKFLPVEIEFDGKIINEIAPIWTKSPNDLTDEDYIKFYKDLYPMSEDPLFWIHLNVDYPFNLTGVLYFPKIKSDIDPNKSKIQLYSRQVFITDEVKDVVPEFLMLLHGVLDSPDIPLNVSRSYLQADSNVRKINSHITKKVADKLAELFKKDRKSYEEKWDDINIFVKYGMLSDEKFEEKAKSFLLLKNTKGETYTIEEYKKKIEETQKDKDENIVALYATNPGAQDSFIQSANSRNYDVLVLDSVLDSHFINHLEQKEEKFSLKRVDAESLDKLVDKGETKESVLSEKDGDDLKAIFNKVSGDEQKYVVAIEPLSPEELPVSIVQPEFARRMKDMAQTGGGGMAFMGSMPETYSVVVNGNHGLMQKILNEKDDVKKEDLAKQSFDIALLSQGMLQGADLTNFIQRSVQIVSKD